MKYILAGDSCTVVVGQSCPDQASVEWTQHKTCTTRHLHHTRKHINIWQHGIYPDFAQSAKSTSSLTYLDCPALLSHGEGLPI